MKAIGYIRVSTTGQVNEGVSLDNQRAKIRAYCELKDIELVGIIEDAGLSGAKSTREGYQRVLSMCGNGEVGSVIVYSISRFTRSTKDLLEFVDTYVIKKGIALHSLSENLDTSTPTGRFMLKVMGAMNELEREQIGERTKSALQYKISRNERAGQIPYGWTLSEDGKTLIENQREQEAIKRIVALKEKGYTLRAICVEITKEGYKPQGKMWHPQSISNILRRAA
ncbi:MAG: recombinase family protein [Candidatus Riflebacteria bacterium]|nr:recombinase family protein [Candidatus Riflebacteria bacterium]